MEDKKFTFQGFPIESASLYVYVDFINACVQYLFERGDYERLAAIASFAEDMAQKSAILAPKAFQEAE